MPFSKKTIKTIFEQLERIIYNSEQIEIWTSPTTKIPILSVYLSDDENCIMIDVDNDDE